MRRADRAFWGSLFASVAVPAIAAERTPDLFLGALSRHHEFPKGTVAFNDATNLVGFGTTRVSLDPVQERISVLVPIQ
jgi:hypothetical protein